MIIRILSNLKGRADSKGASAQFSWDAISSMLQNVGGQSLDYDSFKAAFDSNPAFQQLIDKFDGDGVVVKTRNKIEPAGAPGNKDRAQASVNSSAKRAAANILKK